MVGIRAVCGLLPVSHLSAAPRGTQAVPYGTLRAVQDIVVFTVIALARYIYQDAKEKRPGLRYLPFDLEIAGVDEDEVRTLVNEMAKVILYMPEYLSARVLSDDATRQVRSACLQQLRRADERTKGVVATIDEFVSFCARLSEAENHILVPSGQYTIKQVPARLEHDMVKKT